MCVCNVVGKMGMEGLNEWFLYLREGGWVLRDHAVQEVCFQRFLCLANCLAS